MIRTKSNNVKTVQYAMLDDLIIALSLQYNIYFNFDIYKIVSEFMNYLIDVKDISDKMFEVMC